MSADPGRRLADAEVGYAAAGAVLDAALLSGAVTSVARLALDDAARELAAARSARKVAAHAAEQREADRITERMEVLYQGVIAGVKTTFGDFRLPAIPAGLKIGE